MRLSVLILVAALVACGSAAKTDANVAASPTNSDACGSQASQRDVDGTLIGSTQDSTTIRVGAPSEVRAASQTTFRWRMTGISPLNVYAVHSDRSRIEPSAIEMVNTENWIVRMTFPKAGCWRLHSERAGGKLSGDVWLTVLPPG